VTAGLGSGLFWRARRIRHAAPDERGFTLIEMLIAVSIMGTCVITMVGTIFTMVVTSSYNRNRSVAEVELRKFADLVGAYDYVDCAQAAEYNAAYTAPMGESAQSQVTGTLKSGSTESLLLWDPPGTASDCAYGLCPGWVNSPQCDRGAQQVTVTVTVGNVTVGPVTIVKRRNAQ
jgi:prepilin-type N-terminal cleavage/methylation domain-containing protein